MATSQPTFRTAASQSMPSPTTGNGPEGPPYRARQRARGKRRRSNYFAAISASVASSIRLEKPHSLSYQDSTFTSVPSITRVWVLS